MRIQFTAGISDMDTANGFSFSKDIIGDTARFHLHGSINERTELEKIFKDLDGIKKLYINMADISYINSCGVRDWVVLFRELSKEFDIHYEECSPVVVEQMNMITNFLVDGEIVSVMVPYYCDCGAHLEKVAKLEKGAHTGDGTHEPDLPDVTCPECGREMNMEEDEEQYFEFLEKE